jgi:hypothetical protein
LEQVEQPGHQEVQVMTVQIVYLIHLQQMAVAQVGQRQNLEMVQTVVLEEVVVMLLVEMVLVVPQLLDKEMMEVLLVVQALHPQEEEELALLELLM